MNERSTDNLSDQASKIFEGMALKWPSTVVARKSVREFSGGLVSPKTMANEDSLGKGIQDRFYFKGQTCYPVESLIVWLKNRVTPRWKMDTPK